MVALEFGVPEEEVRRPVWAGLTSGGLFFLGSLPSFIPFAFLNDPMYGLAVSGLCTSISLLIVGIIKSFATREGWLYSSLENFAITGFGSVIAFGMGVCFKQTSNPR
mmetsp:Transcript_18468/g.22613  ORF Transcript_18468/g.22613 Transcript_18468/m.22613 type:complete len:107 (+) Transcript_18468:664-984(+)